MENEQRKLRGLKKPKKRKGFSGLFRKQFVITISVMLLSFVFLGSALMILVAGVWMNEKLDLLEENTKSVSRNAEMVLSSQFNGNKGGGVAALIYNSISQASDILDADFFITNEQGEVVFCKEMAFEYMLDENGRCFIHGTQNIPADIVKSISKGQQYRATGTMDGQFVNQTFIIGCPLTIKGEFKGTVFGTMPVANGLLPYISGIFRMFSLASLIAFAIAFVLVYAATYRMVKPLRQMSEAAKQYAVGDFSNRVTVTHSKVTSDVRTEIDELAEAFNSMATDLSALEMSRRSFVSNVSHELKTPMTTISGFIDGILDGTIDKENQDKYLSIVSDEVKRLSRLVTGMLNMTKLEAGKMEIKPVEFDISEMLFNTLLSFEQIIEKRNIDVQGLEEVSENKVIADKDMINQVVYNLVDNAVKFTPDGGCITVASKSDAEKTIIKIRNTGNGIAPDEINKIFERFYKVDKSRSYDAKGAGMGLYIVKSIIEIHGGTIEARSEVGEYTEFIFNLPK